MPEELTILESRIPLSLELPPDLVDRVAQVEWYCDRWNEASAVGETVVSRIGNLMKAMRDSGELRERGYSSINDFIHRYLNLRIRKGPGTLYNWLRIADASIPERLVLERGSSVALEIAKEVPQPGTERDRFIRSINELPEGAGLRQVQELRAIRRHQPVAAIRQGAMTILGTEEEVEQAKQDLAAWRARNQEHGGASDALLISEAVAVASMEVLLPGYRAMRAELEGLLDLLPAHHATRVGELLAEVDQV